MDNKMTFFSGTDTATLKEEGIDRNHFVSLIVNNEGTYTAAITRKLKSTKVIEEKFSYSTFEDSEVVDSKSYEVENEELQWFYLNIEFERDKEPFYKEISNRLEEIKKYKAEKSKLFPNNKVYSDNRVYQNNIPKQGNLFPSMQDNYGNKKNDKSYIDKLGASKVSNKDNELPFEDVNLNNGISESLPYGQIGFSKDTIKSLVLQLITGSIIIPNSSKIDINKWVKGMVPLYEKRFGKDDEGGLKLFNSWADAYIEFLCWYSEDEELINLGLDDEEMAAICAHDLIVELSKLPKNKYIEMYIDILEGYLI